MLACDQPTDCGKDTRDVRAFLINSHIWWPEIDTSQGLLNVQFPILATPVIDTVSRVAGRLNLRHEQARTKAWQVPLGR